MSFRFRVGKVWYHPQRRIWDVIGVLEEGDLLPPVTAKVVDHPGETVQIDSVALGGVLPGGQLTFVVSQMTMAPQMVEGCLLSDI